jgi:hypothetical protein
VAVQEIADESCEALNRVTQPLDRSTVHRFVVGVDAGPVALSADEAAALLGDPLATLLLLRGRFPRTGAELVDELKRAADERDPLQRLTTFVLGEGSQIPFTDATAGLDRGLRFLATCGVVGAPELIISTPGPDEPVVEAMAWDRVSGGFNFYRAVAGAWVFAGNSRAALEQGSAGKGPFESHVSGNLLMKELRKPWIHWHSPNAGIFATAFAADDARRAHPWFTDAEGGDVFEKAVAKPTIRRWTKARFAARVEPAARVLAQIVQTRTVNLVTSHIESRRAVTSGEAVDLPQTFFVDSEALTEVLGLAAPPPLSMAAEHYARTLETFAFALRAGRFEQPGDTHFAFIVPERAFEDRVVLEAAIASGLVPPRLAACLLMVDFPNPVFSARRASLLAHAPDVADAQFAQATAEAILAAVDGSPLASPEREFAELWAAVDDWPARFDERLAAYYDAIVLRLATQDGADDYTRLAESRRERVRELPIFENRLLFATTNIAPAQLAMRPDGTVAAR